MATAAFPTELRAYIDGGSRGNPGPAGFGVVFQDSQGRLLETLAEPIGTATNNVAEYRALLAALTYAAQTGGRRLQVYCDSELVVRQMQGRYRVQSPDLKPLYEQARKLANSLDHFTISHIPREQNSQADSLANQAMDQAQAPSAKPAYSLLAVFENGRFRPLAAASVLEEGAEYEIRFRKVRPGPG